MADQTIIDGNGGIYQTHPSLVDLAPVLRVDGQDVATGAAGVGMGLQHGSDIHFLAPTNGSGLPQNVVPAIFNTITTGAAQVVGIAIEGVSEALLNPLTGRRYRGAGLPALRHRDGLPGEGERRRQETRTTDAGLRHDRRGQCDRRERGPGDLRRLRCSANVRDWVGLALSDADRSVLGIWPIDRLDPPGGEPKDLLLIAGAEGSLFESLIYEGSYGQESVSTIKILEVASDLGVTIYKRWNTLPLPANTHSASDRTALQNAIGQRQRGHVSRRTR